MPRLKRKQDWCQTSCVAARLRQFPHAYLARRGQCVSTIVLALVGLTMLASVPAAVRAEETSSDSPAVARAQQTPAGTLVIIGGSARHDNDPIWERIVRLAHTSKPRIAVFPSASANPLRNGQKAVDHFTRLGASAFLVPVALSGIPDSDHREAVRNSSIVESVRSADGVFFIGGSQSKIRDVLTDEEGRNTPLLDAVWEVYRRGGVVAGTSAGAAIMSRIMYREPASILSTMLHGVRMGKDVDQGLGFLDPSWFVDQHCLVRGRFARALVAMQAQKVPFGIGIDEDSAIVVEREVEAQVIGARGAVVIDLSVAKSDDTQAEFNIRNARLSYLNHGDRINLKTLAITPSPEKLRDRKIDPAAPDFRPQVSRRLFYNDILGNTTLTDVLTRVIDHKEGRATGLAFDGLAAQQGPTTGFEFKFYRGPGSVGWETDHNGTSDCTIQNIYLDVCPVNIHGPIYSARETGEKP